jgi:hypothetical protein
MAVRGVGRQLRKPNYKRSLVFAFTAGAEETLHRAEILSFHVLLKFFLTQDTYFLGDLLMYNISVPQRKFALKFRATGVLLLLVVGN